MSYRTVSAADEPIGGSATPRRQKRGTTSLYQPIFKNSKGSSSEYVTTSRMKVTTIDDLPDLVLVEILCRLLNNVKLVVQCRCVSRRWLTLISDSYFISRFLGQHRVQEASPTAGYVMVPCKDNKIIPLTSSSSNLPSTMSLSFLPCFQSPNLDNEPTVQATFQDLVLCCATESYHFHYYICNPLTKQWVALPPVPQVIQSQVDDRGVKVGFICEPYYDDEREEHNSIMKLNADYRCRVVRILPNSIEQPELGSFVEIFTSETGEWREYQLPNPTWIRECGGFHARRPGVACRGKLYWSGRFLTLELDPFNISTTSDFTSIDQLCRFITHPWTCINLSVCQGRLRTYPLWTSKSITIWERKGSSSGNLEWCLVFKFVPMLDMVSEDPKITKEKLGKLDVLGVHPSNGDIVYLKFPEDIVMCNLVKKTLEKSPVDPDTDIQLIGSSWDTFDRPTSSIHPYVLPWWPTPVPKINRTKGFEPASLI